MGIIETLGLRPGNTKSTSSGYFAGKHAGAEVFGLTGAKLNNEYRQLPVVYAVVNAIARRAASVPIRFYRAGSEAEVDNHPAIDRLMEPKPMWTWRHFMSLWVVRRAFYGEWLVRKNPDISKGVPITLDPIPFGEYEAAYNAKTFTGWKIAGRAYDPSEVIYDRIVNPWDDVRGLAPLSAARVANETEWAARQYNRRFFENDASPGGFFKSEGLTDAQRERMKHELIESRRGTDQAHKWLLLENIDVQQLGITQRDAQFIEQFGLTLHDVCSVFGVDPAVIGFEKESKYASAKEARKYMWTDTVIPLLSDVESVLNTQFLNDYGLQLFFDTENIEALQDNMTDVVAVARQYYDMGVPFNVINERLDLGFDPIEGGDQPRHTAPALFDAKPEETKQFVIGPKIAEGGKLTSPEVQRAINTMVWKDVTSGVESIVGELNRSVKRYFFEAGKRIERAMKDAEEKTLKAALDFDTAIIDDSLNLNELLTIVIRFITRAGLVGYSQITGVSLDFSNVPNEVLNAVADRAGKIKEVVEHARSEIQSKVQDVIREAIEQGLPERDTAQMLIDALGDSMDNLQSRAKTIARTEVHSAHSQARYDAMKSTNPIGKRWVADPDETVTRPSHIAAMEEGVIPFDELFSNNLSHPHDPMGDASEVINCRCIMVPVYEEGGR